MPEQTLKLLQEMHSQAEIEAHEKVFEKKKLKLHKRFPMVSPLYQARPCNLMDFLPEALTKEQLIELTAAFNATSAAPLEYAFRFATDDIPYFINNISSNSQNFVSMFARNVGGTATTNDDETFYRGTHNIPAPGTIGAYLDHVGNSCSVSEIDVKNPEEALVVILHKEFTRKSGNSILIDSGALFNGINRETVAQMMMRHIMQENLTWQCVFYFTENGEQVYIQRPKTIDQIPQLQSKPLKNCTVPLNKRAGYFDQVNTLGQDVPQDPKAKFISTKQDQQGDGRARKYRQSGKQTMKTVLNNDVRTLISGNCPATIDAVINFNQIAEAEPKGYNNYLSAHQQIDDVTRKTVLITLIKTMRHSGAQAALPIFHCFKSVLIQQTEEDPFILYGLPKVKADPYVVLEKSKEVQFKRLQESGLISEQDLKQAWEAFEPLGKGTYPKQVIVDAGTLKHRPNNLGLAQEVVQTQQQQQNQNVNRENLLVQEVQQNQHLQMENHTLGKKADHLRLELAEWPARYNHFIGLNWLKTQPIQTKTNHHHVMLYNVKDTIKHLGVHELKAVYQAFSGSMWWTNNLVGILESGELSPPGGKFKVPIFEILVIHYTNPQGNIQIITGGLHPDEAAAWRNRFNEDRASTADRRHSRVKICLFDLNTNSVVDSGYQRLCNEELFSSDQFSDDVFRWKFLAGQVNIQQRRLETTAHDAATFQRFKQWIEINDKEKMKEAFLKIYTHRGIRPIIGSDMEHLYIRREKLLVDTIE